MIESSSKIRYSRIFKRKSFLSQEEGITLTELLATAIISSILILLAGSGVISMISVNKKSEEESTYLFEFNRAMEYIANDIRESRNVLNTTPLNWTNPTGYTPVFFLDKPFNVVTKATENPTDDLDNIVAYYTKTPSVNEGWKLDQTVYRQFYNGSSYELAPLLDGLSNTTVTCGSGGTTAGSNGFRVNINGKRVHLCLQSKANDVGDIYNQTTTIAIRND